MPNTTELPPPSQLGRPVASPAPSSSNTPPPPRRRALKIGLLLAGLLLIAWEVGVPLSAKWAINNFLKTRYSSTISLRHLGFNPFTGHLDLSVQKNSQLVLDRYQMEWDWLPLRQRTLRLNDIQLKNLTVDIKGLANGGLQIGDIHWKGAAETASRAIETGLSHLPLYADVHSVDLENINVTYTDPQLQATLVFDRIHLQATGAAGAAFLHYSALKNSAQQLDFTGEVRVSGLLLQLPIDRRPASAQKSSALEKLRGLTARVSGLVKISGLHVELQPGPEPGRLTPVFRVASLELTNNAAIELQGKGDRTPLDVTFQPVDLLLKNFDSARPGEATSVALETAAGGKSNVRYSLTGKPLVKPLSVEGTGTIVRLALPPFSLLAERFIGYRILKGQLSLDPPLSVKRGQLDSTWDVMLKGLEVEKLKAAERDPKVYELEVPLEKSLLLLKDKNGDIQLQIPLKADLNDPDKAFSALLSQAITAGIKSGVRASLNKVLAPVSSGETLKQVTLTFAPEDAALSTETKQYLKEVAALLTERPGVKLKIKGFGPAADSKLVTQRVENVKTHLTTLYAIPPEQLLIASPELSDKPAAPRVELSPA